MAAGVFGYLGYDMVRQMEDLAAPNPDPLGVPDAILMRPTIMVVFDAVKDEITVVTPVRPEAGVRPTAAYARAVERLDGGGRRARQRRSHKSRRHVDAGCSTSPPSRTRTPAEYPAHGARGRRNTSPPATSSRSCCRSASRRRSTCRPSRSIARCGGSIRRRSSTFSISAASPIVGSSPEILVRVRDGKVTIRPIAGTRPRGATPHEDEALDDELLADPKERAEHLMLLDLGRNDVGRVAEIGTRQGHRQVLHRALQPRHAHRLERRGRARREATMRSTRWSPGFPAGTVSGAPKVRAMEIIDELEKEKRGIYAGCVGYFSAAGEMDTCIVLRTAMVKDGKMYVQAGAGIVADCDPGSPSSRNASTRPRRCSAPPRRRVRFASAAERGQ